MHAPAKVANLELAIYSQQEILGLDIAVDHVFAMQISKRVCHLRHVLGPPDTNTNISFWPQSPQVPTRAEQLTRLLRFSLKRP
jgi:hypothetical protein